MCVPSVRSTKSWVRDCVLHIGGAVREYSFVSGITVELWDRVMFISLMLTYHA